MCGTTTQSPAIRDTDCHTLIACTYIPKSTKTNGECVPMTPNISTISTVPIHVTAADNS